MNVEKRVKQLEQRLERLEANMRALGEAQNELATACAPLTAQAARAPAVDPAEGAFHVH